MQNIPFIEVSGSNYDIGFTVGSALKKQIKNLVKLEGEKYREDTERVKFLIRYVNKYFPKSIAELKGMSEGSGTDINTLFTLGCEDEFRYNCTSVAGFSEDGIILAHNEDWLKTHLNSLYICKIKQKNKPTSISLSYAGHLPGFSFGLNSKNLAFTENALHFRKVNPKGIPIHFFTRAFLDVEKVSELIRLATMPNKMVGWSSLIVYGNKIFDLEITPKTFVLLKGQKYLAHTNHVLSPKIITQEKSHSKDSLWRLERANELLKTNKLNFELVKKILADHKHRPFSICCHEFEKQDETPYATLASVIANINKKELYVAHGNPCKSRYERYRL